MDGVKERRTSGGGGGGGEGEARERKTELDYRRGDYSRDAII